MRTAKRTLDVYELAYLAGGPCRAVDAAVIALVEAGVVAVDRSTGELVPIERRSCSGVEAAVLAALGSQGDRFLDTVCGRLRADGRLTAIEHRLQADRLLVRGGGLGSLSRRWWEVLAITDAGRRTLRRRRRALSPEGTDALRAALSGPAALRGRSEYVALFDPPRRGTSAASSAGGHPHGAMALSAGGAGVGGFGGADFGGGGDGAGC